MPIAVRDAANHWWRYSDTDTPLLIADIEVYLASADCCTDVFILLYKHEVPLTSAMWLFIMFAIFAGSASWWILLVPSLKRWTWYAIRTPILRLPNVVIAACVCGQQSAPVVITATGSTNGEMPSTATVHRFDSLCCRTRRLTLRRRSSLHPHSYQHLDRSESLTRCLVLPTAYVGRHLLLHQRQWPANLLR